MSFPSSIGRPLRDNLTAFRSTNNRGDNLFAGISRRATRDAREKLQNFRDGLSYISPIFCEQLSRLVSHLTRLISRHEIASLVSSPTFTLSVCSYNGRRYLYDNESSISYHEIPLNLISIHRLYTPAQSARPGLRKIRKRRNASRKSPLPSPPPPSSPAEYLRRYGMPVESSFDSASQSRLIRVATHPPMYSYSACEFQRHALDRSRLFSLPPRLTPLILPSFPGADATSPRADN